MADSYSDAGSSCSLEILYRNRPEWKDIKPIPQDDGPYPIARIAYSENFVDAHDYLRAVIHKNELSERALELTASVIEQNPANYTAWEYRRQILKALKSDLRKELKYSREIIEENPKNYQVWHHRQKIVEWLQDPSAELLTINIILQQDDKNYHAWQYRQWVVKTFSLYEDELNYTEQCLKCDIRNNSAWNHRYFVISNSTGWEKDILNRESLWIHESIHIAPGNESAWNYLRGILKHADQDKMYPVVEKFCKKIVANHPSCSHGLGLLIDIWTFYMDSSELNISTYLNDALESCRQLYEKVDKTRENYWKYVEKKLERKYGSVIYGDGSGDHRDSH